MNAFERFKFKRYKYRKGLKFGTKYSGVPMRNDYIHRQEVYAKNDWVWDTYKVYYPEMKSSAE